MADELSVDAELEEIVEWIDDVPDPVSVRGAIVNRLKHVVWRLQNEDDAGAGDQLLVVAVRTDGHDLPRRMGQVLAVAQPAVVRGQPLAWCKPVGELTAADALLLAGMFGETAGLLGFDLESLAPGLFESGEPL